MRIGGSSEADQERKGGGETNKAVSDDRENNASSGEYDLSSELTKALLAFIPLYVVFIYGFLHGFLWGPTLVPTIALYAIIYFTTGLILASQTWYLLCKPIYLEHRNSNTALATAFLFLPSILLLWPLFDLSYRLIFGISISILYTPGLRSDILSSIVIYFGWMYGLLLLITTLALYVHSSVKA